MRIKTLCRCVLTVLLGLSSPSAKAAFQDPLISPKAAAMGSASLASYGDSTSLFLNPAGMASLERPDFYFMYNQLYAGLSGVSGIGQGFISGGVPTRLGTFGVGLGGMRASGLQQEYTFSLSYARAISDRLQIGITGKQLYHNYLIGSDPNAAIDPVFKNGTSRGALALDAGIIASLSEPLKLGLVIRNINQPNVGLATQDPVLRQIQAGLIYDFKQYGLRTTADLLFQDNGFGSGPGSVLPALGLEKSLYGDKVAFRLGFNLQQFSGGFGVRVGDIGFDYAFVLTPSLMQNNFGSHLIGMHFMFGGPKTKLQSTFETHE